MIKLNQQECVPWVWRRFERISNSNHNVIHMLDNSAAIDVSGLQFQNLRAIFDTEEKRLQFLRGAVGQAAFQIAVLVLYLSSKSEQRVLAQMCGVRQSTISKALRRAKIALLLQYGSNGTDPQLGFHVRDTSYVRDVVKPWFRNRTQGIPYIWYIIDGTHKGCSSLVEISIGGGLEGFPGHHIKENFSKVSVICISTRVN